jgi:molybdate transport system regulatory protein
MANSPDFPKLRFRLVLGRSIAVGPGKADLLAAVAETGSITAAGRSMGMSYKRAWYLLDTMNKCFREPLVSASKGGKGHGGAHLTPIGEQVLSLYRTIEARAAEAAAKELGDLHSPGGRNAAGRRLGTPSHQNYSRSAISVEVREMGIRRRRFLVMAQICPR